MITGASNISRDRNRTWPFMFNCVDEEWQHNACAIMGLEFVAGNGLNHGGPHVILKRPRTSSPYLVMVIVCFVASHILSLVVRSSTDGYVK